MIHRAIESFTVLYQANRCIERRQVFRIGGVFLVVHGHSAVESFVFSIDVRFRVGPRRQSNIHAGTLFRLVGSPSTLRITS